MLMIHVNAPFQISSGIFVYGEIIKTHTVHERKYKAIKELVMGTVKLIKN